jgi:hypothetical protein
MDWLSGVEVQSRSLMGWLNKPTKFNLDIKTSGLMRLARTQNPHGTPNQKRTPTLGSPRWSTPHRQLQSQLQTRELFRTRKCIKRCTPNADFLAELHLAIVIAFLPVLTVPVHLHSGFDPTSGTQNANSPSSDTLNNTSCS